MKNFNKKLLYLGLSFFMAFILWTALVCVIDVSAVGPTGSLVGFSRMNVLFHDITGLNMDLYTITDWLGLVPVATVLGFAVLGVTQWIKRKKLKLVDYSIFVLAGFYVVVIAIYIFFEVCVINYRPVLINGVLEPSYPSSTTLLTMTVMPTAIIQLNNRIKSIFVRKIVSFVIVAFVVFMVVGRLFSGVHWVSDIIGGALISAGLVSTYCFVSKLR